jgi:hypothetical protein
MGVPIVLLGSSSARLTLRMPWAASPPELPDLMQPLILRSTRRNWMLKQLRFETAWFATVLIASLRPFKATGPIARGLGRAVVAECAGVECPALRALVDLAGVAGVSRRGVNA